MSNPFSNDTTTTGARAGNAAYNNLSTEAKEETDAIAEVPGLIGGGVITKIADTASGSGGTKVLEDFVPPPSAAVPNYQNIQQTKFDNIKTTTVAVDNHLERTYVDIINAKKHRIVTLLVNYTLLLQHHYPAANQRLITTTGAASGDSAHAAVNPTGISTFIYPSGCDPDPSTCTTNVDCCLIGVRGLFIQTFLRQHTTQIYQTELKLQVQFLQHRSIKLLLESQGAPLQVTMHQIP